MAIAGSQGKKRVLSLWILLRLDLLEQIVLSMWNLFSLVDSTGEIAWYLFIFQGIQTLAVSPPPFFLVSTICRLLTAPGWDLWRGTWPEAEAHKILKFLHVTHICILFLLTIKKHSVSLICTSQPFSSSLPPHGHLGWFQFGGHSEYDYRITGYCF